MEGRNPVTSPHPQAAGQRAICFIDGQNLFGAAKDAFGYTYPNYDAKKLAERVCRDHGWICAEVRFYTGVPEPRDDPFWHHFWTAKLAQMGRMRVVTFSRALRYNSVTIKLKGGAQVSTLKGREKGVDVRIALDMVRAARQRRGQVLVVFSQDQDLTEAVDEVRTIAHDAGHHIHIASAYPSSPTYRNTKGLDRTQWIRIDLATYDACLDTRDYRPKKKP